MIIGVPKEIKNQENRVSLTPAGVHALKDAGHTIYIQSGAGEGAAFQDSEYAKFGAVILNSASEVWEKSNMILKVKAPLEEEYKYFRKDLIIFTFLHLANEPDLTRALVEAKTTAIAYETVELPNRSLPILTPMSEIGGRLAVQEGAVYLQKTHGGKGKLVDGVPGVAPAHIVVVGAGMVGTGAIRRAIGIGARVTVLDVNLDRLRYLGEVFIGKIETLYSNKYNMSKAIENADLVVGAVLIPGSKAPKLITEEMVKTMEKGSVIVDVAIDQGGCVETIEGPTSHENPTFVKHGVIHYAVGNIPGAVPQTSTLALTNVTLPYVLKISNMGWREAAKRDSSLAKGLNITDGHIVYKSVADTFDMDYTPLEDII